MMIFFRKSKKQKGFIQHHLPPKGRSAFGGKNGPGFTLLEAILYIAIVAILLVAVIDFHLIMGKTSDKLLANITASRDRRVALESLDYLAKNANDLLKDTYNDCSTFNTSPQVLALYFNNDTYLPGTCVSTGGGVRISLENQRLRMTCYPGIPYNGWSNACSTSTYPAGNSYYLTSVGSRILNSGLSFSTSTATSTLNSFTTLSSHLEAISLSGNQINLVATSTATSTVVINNKQSSGLVTFWKFDDDILDSQGRNNGTCVDTMGYVSGLVANNTKAMDFEYDSSSYCYFGASLASPESLMFTDAFTITAWIKPETMSAVSHMIFNNSDGSTKGIQLYVNGTDARIDFKIYDGSTSQITSTGAGTIANGSTYHVTAVYDYKGGVQKIFLYKKTVGQVATSTSPATIPILVNYNTTTGVSYTSSFDGVIDDLRFYNRALSNEEVWALQSQGN